MVFLIQKKKKKGRGWCGAVEDPLSVSVMLVTVTHVDILKKYDYVRS